MNGARLGVAVLLTLHFCLAARAQQPDPDLIYKSNPQPDRIALTVNGDPCRTMAVSWRTDLTVGKGQAQIARAEEWTQFTKEPRTLTASTRKLTTDLGDANYHTVVFDGLMPGTKYFYRVGDGESWTEWFRFQTASAEREPFSFVYFGDAQHAIKEHWSRIIREAHATAPRARFHIHAGDLININDRDAEWGEWFHAGGWLHATIPSVPAMGNHDFSGLDPQTDDTLKHWNAQFALPRNGPAGLHETAYYIDYQGVRVVCLNSNAEIGAQAAWLDKVLASNPQRWTVVTFHHPIFSTARGRDNSSLREAWQPIFDKYRVDLVLNGHDHSYGRSGLKNFENRRGGGTVYVVSVSGPGMYPVDDLPWARRSADYKQLFQVIHIDGDRLRFEARTALGQIFDAFELRKHSGGTNELVEGTPDITRPSASPFNARTGLVFVAVLLTLVLLALRMKRRSRGAGGSPAAPAGEPPAPR